jgi:transcription elongation factor Elf1
MLLATLQIVQLRENWRRRTVVQADAKPCPFCTRESHSIVTHTLVANLWTHMRETLLICSNCLTAAHFVNADSRNESSSSKGQ